MVMGMPALGVPNQLPLNWGYHADRHLPCVDFPFSSLLHLGRVDIA